MVSFQIGPLAALATAGEVAVTPRVSTATMQAKRRQSEVTFDISLVSEAVRPILWERQITSHLHGCGRLSCLNAGGGASCGGASCGGASCGGASCGGA